MIEASLIAKWAILGILLGNMLTVSINRTIITRCHIIVRRPVCRPTNVLDSHICYTASYLRRYGSSHPPAQNGPSSPWKPLDFSGQSVSNTALTRGWGTKLQAGDVQIFEPPHDRSLQFRNQCKLKSCCYICNSNLEVTSSSLTSGFHVNNLKEGTF